MVCKRLASIKKFCVEVLANDELNFDESDAQ